MRQVFAAACFAIATQSGAAVFPDYMVVREPLGWDRDNGGGRLERRALLARIVDASGTTLFEELHCDVPVTGQDGEIELALGTVDPLRNPLDLRFDDAWFLRVLACDEAACEDGIPMDAGRCEGPILLDKPLQVVAYAWRAKHASEADHARFADDCDRLDGLDSSDFLRAGTDEWVDETGDAMSGPLVLSGEPTADLQAATKKYVDEQIRNAIPRGYAILGPGLASPPGFAPSGAYIATDGEWQTLAPLQFAGETSATTRDGQLLARGIDTIGIYDAATDTWGFGPAPATGQLITNLDGSLHVIGDYRGDPVHWEELPGGLWVARAPPPLVPVESIVALGGRIFALADDTFSSWDAATDTWRPLMRSRYRGHYGGRQLVVLDDRIWAIGGVMLSDDVPDTVDVYDPATGGWTPGPRLKRPHRHAAVAELDGRIYVFGGDAIYGAYGGGGGTGDANSSDAIEVYDPSVGAWALDPSRLPTDRIMRGAAAVAGRIHLVGGRQHHWGGSSGTSVHEAFTPQQRWFVHVKQ